MSQGPPSFECHGDFLTDVSSESLGDGSVTVARGVLLRELSLLELIAAHPLSNDPTFVEQWARRFGPEATAMAFRCVSLTVPSRAIHELCTLWHLGRWFDDGGCPLPLGFPFMHSLMVEPMAADSFGVYCGGTINIATRKMRGKGTSCLNRQQSADPVLLYQILGLASVLHSAGVVGLRWTHDNVMTSKNALDVCLLDLAHASRVPVLVKEAQTLSVLSPPEVIFGDDVSSRMPRESWALGCYMYSLVVGEPLFEVSTNPVDRVELLSAIVEELGTQQVFQDECFDGLPFYAC